MSNYLATLITKTSSGEFKAETKKVEKVNLHGSLSFNEAMLLARKALIEKAILNKIEYAGFAIEKTKRFSKYRNFFIIDNNTKPEDILHLN